MGIGYSCKCNRRLCFTDGTGNSFALDRPPRNSIGSMTMCLWKSEIRVGVFGLNLRLAPLILATINILWFWSSKALTGSVYASARYIENRSVLGVMSRGKYHSSLSGDDGHVGYGTRSLKCSSYWDIMTRSCISYYRD